MEVILLEHVNKLGKMGEKVTVKNGYARNYLLPNKKALRATEENMAVYERQKAELEAHNKSLLENATKQAQDLEGFKIVLIRQAAETGQLYGSVSIRDIAAAMKEAGKSIERRFISLERPIKDLGVYKVSVNLHPEVSQTILVNVARTEDEAKRQENNFNKE
jgi:large subunit ribosomal protein L9